MTEIKQTKESPQTVPVERPAETASPAEPAHVERELRRSATARSQSWGIYPAIRGSCPWSPQQMTWASRPSSQSRKVSRVGRNIVQTSSQMITWEWTSAPSFQASTPSGHSIGRSCGRSGPRRPRPASLWPGDGSGEYEGISLAEERERSRGFAAAPAAG